MATPIRMAPVLFGKDAEYFYETWQKSLKEPLKNPITKEEREKIDAFIVYNEKRKNDELVNGL